MAPVRLSFRRRCSERFLAWGSADSPDSWEPEHLQAWTRLTAAWPSGDALLGLATALAAPQPARVAVTLLEEREDGVKVGCTFESIDDEAREAVRQYADDMAFLKEELRRATN